MNHRNNALIDSLPPLDNASLWGDDVALINEHLPHLLKLSNLQSGNKNKQDTMVDLSGAGIIMYNPQGQANLAVYNGHRKAFTAFAYQDHAIILGDRQSPSMAVLGVENAIALYNDQKDSKDGICVLTLPDDLDYHFEKMIKAFSPKYVITTDDKPINTDCTVISHFAPLAIALQSLSFDDFIGDCDTAIERENWGQLKPLNPTKTHANPYPVHAFGELAGVVTAISECTQTPLSMAGQSILGALSTICQSFVNAPMGYEHKPVSLFLLTESPSGAGKTQVNKLAYKTVFEYDKAIYQQFLQDVKNWDNAIKTLKGKDKAQFFNDHAEPVNRTLTIKDGSIEKILDRFVKGEIHNQSWATDEAGLFFGGYSMKSDTTANALSCLTDLWSTGTANRQRMSNKTPYTNAYNCRFTLDLAGQRVVLEPAINDELMNGQGFLARCLFACEPPLIGTRDWITPRDPNESKALLSYWKRCDYLLEMGQQYDKDGKPNRFNMPFGVGAKQALAQYQQRIEYEQAPNGRLANLTAFASRMAENATRIATILAYYDGQKCLTVEYLERAFLLVEFSINERLYYNDKGNEPTNAQKLLNHLIKKRTDGKLLYSQAQMTAPKAIRKKDDFALALDVLQGANYLKIKETDGKRYLVLNPALGESK